MRPELILFLTLVVATLVACRIPLVEAQAKPNIIVIFSDDVGVWNLSAYHRGLMGGRTPSREDFRSLTE